MIHSSSQLMVEHLNEAPSQPPEKKSERWLCSFFFVYEEEMSF